MKRYAWGEQESGYNRLDSDETKEQGQEDVRDRGVALKDVETDQELYADMHAYSILSIAGRRWSVSVLEPVPPRGYYFTWHPSRSYAFVHTCSDPIAPLSHRLNRVTTFEAAVRSL